MSETTASKAIRTDDTEWETLAVGHIAAISADRIVTLEQEPDSGEQLYTNERQRSEFPEDFNLTLHAWFQVRRRLGRSSLKADASESDTILEMLKAPLDTGSQTFSETTETITS